MDEPGPIYCSYCGNRLAPRARYCDACGRRQPLGRVLFDATQVRLPASRRSPGVAALLGFFLGWGFAGPLGYAYLGQWNWVWLTFGVEVFAVALTHHVAWILMPFLFAFHQYDMAQEINRRIEARERRDAGRDAAASTEP